MIFSKSFIFQKIRTDNKNITEVSYNACYLIAFSCEAHICESLIKLCLKDIALSMFDAVGIVSLCNITVSRYNNRTVEDIKEKL